MILNTMMEMIVIDAIVTLLILVIGTFAIVMKAMIS